VNLSPNPKNYILTNDNFTDSKSFINTIQDKNLIGQDWRRASIKETNEQLKMQMMEKEK